MTEGRRAALFASIAMYALGALFNSLAPNITLFIIARFISGCGIGAFIGVASTYVSEVMPAPVRGKFAAWITLPALIGSSGTAFVALAIVPSFADGWRVLLALPVIGLIPLILGAHALPESIRWLIEHDRIDAATQIVTLMETRAQRRLGATELPPVQASVRTAVLTEERASFTAMSIFRPPILRYTVVFFFVWFWNYVAVYGFGTMGVTLLVQHGYSLVHSIQMAIAGGVGYIAGGIVAPFVSDRFSRKWPPFVVTVLVALELLLLGIAPGTFLITLYFFLAAFQVGIFAPLIYLLTAEHFPTSGRNLGMAFSNGVAHVGGAIGPFMATFVAARFGFGALFFALSACFFLCALSLVFAKQTTRRNLEEIIVS
ncbi:MAG: MFS transporter [Acetobacteraceae bacterium]